MSRKGKLRLLLTAAATATLITLGGCGGDSKHEYPADVKNNFLTACEVQGSSSACECALTKLQEKMSADEFNRAEVEMTANGVFPPKVLDAVAECR